MPTTLYRLGSFHGVHSTLGGHHPRRPARHLTVSLLDAYPAPTLIEAFRTGIRHPPLKGRRPLVSDTFTETCPRGFDTRKPERIC